MFCVSFALRSSVLAGDGVISEYLFMLSETANACYYVEACYYRGVA